MGLGMVREGKAEAFVTAGIRVELISTL